MDATARLAAGDIAAMMPSFRVVGTDGTVHEAATYRAAMVLRSQLGGTIATVQP